MSLFVIRKKNLLLFVFNKLNNILFKKLTFSGDLWWMVT